MAIKQSMGKLKLTGALATFLPEQLSNNLTVLMPIELQHVVAVASLPFHHRDPFDRLLIAQSLIEQMPIVSINALFDNYSVQRLW